MIYIYNVYIYILEANSVEYDKPLDLFGECRESKLLYPAPRRRHHSLGNLSASLKGSRPSYGHRCNTALCSLGNVTRKAKDSEHM